MDEKNNVLITSYIIGENLCDIINNEDTSINEKQRLMILLAEWFFNFHNHFKSNNNYIIRGDSILRNFIFTDKIWGVDFEESRKGNIEEDISDICTSILTTNPMYIDEKYKLCKIYLESYSKSYMLKYENIKKEISYSLLRTMINRGEIISKEESDSLVEKIFLLC